MKGHVDNAEIAMAISRFIIVALADPSLCLENNVETVKVSEVV
jgi:hypothetical protein